MKKYEIYIHKSGLNENDIYYGSTPIKAQADAIIKSLNERGEDVKYIIILEDGTKYDYISFRK